MLQRFADGGLKCFLSLLRGQLFRIMPFVVSPSTGKASWLPPSVSGQLCVLPLRSQTMITRNGHAPTRSGVVRGARAVAASCSVAAPGLRSQRRPRSSKPQLAARQTSRAGSLGVQPHFRKSQTVKPITGGRYRAANTEFLASLSLCHLVLLCQVVLDVTLCQHIHLLDFRGEASAAVRALLHGLVYVQRLTPRGPYEQKFSTVALNEFEQGSPDQQADPAPLVATVLPADWAVSLFLAVKALRRLASWLLPMTFLSVLASCLLAQFATSLLLMPSPSLRWLLVGRHRSLDMSRRHGAGLPLPRSDVLRSGRLARWLSFRPAEVCLACQSLFRALP
jgi:hypothetical protein